MGLGFELGLEFGFGFESAAAPAEPMASWSLSAAFWIWLLRCSDRLRTASCSATGTCA